MNYRGLILNNQPVKTWRDRWLDMGGWSNIPNRGYQAKKKDDTAEILIFEQIGKSWWDDSGVGAKEFTEDLKALGDVKSINVRINSPGGDVFEADAIYSALNNHPATINVFIDGIAASAASYIAMAGDSISIAEHAKFMIHSAWGFAMGNADDMRATADILDVVDSGIRIIYQRRTKHAESKIKDWMKAETWWVGQAAIDDKFADSLMKAKGPVEDRKQDPILDLMRMRLALARSG